MINLYFYYVEKVIFFRGYDRIYGEDVCAYSMPPVLCTEKVTKENMLERAKSIGRKHIIVLNKYSYSIIDIN